MALDKFSTAIRRDGLNWNAWSQRAQARQRAGDLLGAEEDYDRAIGLKPGLSASYERRADVRQTRGNLGGALADHDAAISLKPTAIKYCLRARLRAALGDFLGSIADYDAGISLDPYFAGDHCRRAALKVRLGDLTGAAEDYDEALRLDPQSLDASTGRAALPSAHEDGQETPMLLTPRLSSPSVFYGEVGQHGARELQIVRFNTVTLRHIAAQPLKMKIASV